MNNQNDMSTLNILYSSDENYAQHLGVSMYSLLKTNQDSDKIHVYIIDNEISADNQAKLRRVAAEFSKTGIDFIPFAHWKEKLKLNMEWNISLSSYARLFMDSMLPASVNRILYLDCDMIVCDSLRQMWETDLEGCVLGAVQDSIGDETKNAVGLSPNERYFNAGMLLVDLARWRADHMEEKCLQFIADRNGNVIHHDQGVLNGLCHHSVKILPVRNNLMTIHFIYTRAQTLKYFGEHASFYSEKEIQRAKDSPVILHYTPSFTCRPWVKGCAHPRKDLYWKTLAKTPWDGALPQKNRTPLHVRLVEWRYRIFPY